VNLCRGSHHRRGCGGQYAAVSTVATAQASSRAPYRGRTLRRRRCRSISSAAGPRGSRRPPTQAPTSAATRRWRRPRSQSPMPFIGPWRNGRQSESGAQREQDQRQRGRGHGATDDRAPDVALCGAALSIAADAAAHSFRPCS
jgi:hypothetical protein